MLPCFSIAQTCQGNGCYEEKTKQKKTLMKYFPFFLREPFIIAALTGLTETNTTLLEGRLGLTKMK